MVVFVQLEHKCLHDPNKMEVNEINTFGETTEHTMVFKGTSSLVESSFVL